MSRKSVVSLSVLEKAAAVSLALCVVLNLFSFLDDVDGVRNKVLRLRVIANSDMLCDQRLKLAVRDGILDLSGDIFDGCEDIAEAEAMAQSRFGEFESAARGIIAANGFDYDVRLSLCRDRFPTRNYGGTVLPAGEYNTLRIEIGSAQGHNWWCVMFPMLCVPSSGQQGMEDILSDGELRVVEADGYDVRFKCAELYERIRNAEF